MLLADPSELRSGSRLPEVLKTVARPCVGLEERTGADLLLTPLGIPFTSDTLLKRHCEAGVLVQRKTGLDLAASIMDGRLNSSLLKMKDVGPRPWLAVVGDLENRGGRGFIDGRETLSYAAMVGALDWWQLRGGYLSLLADNDAFVAWLNSWYRRLDRLEKDADKVVAHPVLQEMFESPHLTTLLSLPGIGSERAQELLDAASGRLGKALELLTTKGRYVKGVGEGTKTAVRKWLSMGEDERLAVMDEKLLGTAIQGCLELAGNENPEVALVAQALHAGIMQLGGLASTGRCTGSWGEWYEDWKEANNLPPAP